MSLANEKQRLDTAKAETINALKAKGVSVPSGVKVSDFPSLINSISTGGSSGGGSKVTQGTYTPARDIKIKANPVHINHGLSVTPDFFVMVRIGGKANKMDVGYAYYNGVKQIAGIQVCNNIVAGIPRFYSTIEYGGTDVTADSMNIVITSSDPSDIIPGGQEYIWIAGKF